MTWNYRIMKRKVEIEDEYVFMIHEVYYNDNKEIQYWSENGIDPFGITLDDLKKDLEKMLDAFNKPVLDEDAVKKELLDRKMEKDNES